MRSKAGNRLEQLALSFLPEAFILFLDCSHEAEHRNPAPTPTPTPRSLSPQGLSYSWDTKDPSIYLLRITT